MSHPAPSWAPAPLIAIVGWKNSGKTTMVENLVRIFTGRGLRVATVKHAHHSFDIDRPGTDSFRHRAAGASQVAIASRNRTALVFEHAGEAGPALEQLVARLDPCDLIIVEGYKGDSIPKLEMRRREGRPGVALSLKDSHVIAVAADHEQPGEELPVLDLHEPERIADFIVERIFSSRQAGGTDAESGLDEA